MLDAGKPWKAVSFYKNCQPNKNEKDPFNLWNTEFVDYERMP